MKRKSNLKAALKSLYGVVNSYTDKSGRMLAEIFLTLPDKDEYPDYYTIITNPIALDIIHEKIENNSYSELLGLYNDLNLMLENAKIYNRKGSIVYRDAVTLLNALEEAYSGEKGKISPKKGKTDLKGIITKLMETRQSELFQDLPDKNIYPDYYVEIKNPIALNNILEKINKGSSTIQDVEKDLKLMVSNAKQYNAEGSEVVADAEFLLNTFYETAGITPSREGLVAPIAGAFKLDSFKIGREVYKIGDCIFLKNAIDPSKPIIGQIYDIWSNKNGGPADGLTVCWFLLPDQTVHRASTKFMEKEVLKSNQFVNYSTKDVSGKCWILQVKDYCRGRPQGATFENTFVCESRYNDQAKNISKIKNWSSAVPEAIRGIEPELELFDSPLVPIKVLSSFGESALKKGAEEMVTEEEQEEDADEEEEEEIVEQAEKRGRPRRSIPNTTAITPSAQEKKIMFVPGPIRPPAPSVPAGPQLQVAPNPYLGIPAHSTPVNPGASSGRPNFTPTPGPSGPTNQINPLYYNQLGNLPGDTISESTAQCFDRLPDGRVKWFAGPPLDVVDEEEPMHSSEYLLKLASEPLVKADKKSQSKPKKEALLNMDLHSPSNDVDWSPVTQTLQELASIWLKDAQDVLNASLVSS